jgi:MFS family permease
MQSAAILWHVYTLTQSKYALGAVGLVRVVPLVALALAGGVVADAVDRRRLMMVTQGFLALLAAALGLWTLAGLPHAWPIYAVAGLSAGAMAFDGPARQSMVPLLVPREELASALSLNSITSQLASIAGPALMGLLIARYSIGLVYCVNAVSFLAVIAALLAMRTGGGTDNRAPVSLGAAIEGLRFMWNSRLLTSLMLLDFLATFFGSATVLLPVVATERLSAGAQDYGMLVAAPSAGALVAAFGMSLRGVIGRQGLVVLGAVFAYGLATIAFGLARTLPICLLALAASGAADTVSTVLRQTIRQLNTPDHLRGRMTSVNMMFFMGGPQLGELEAGLVAGWQGAAFSIVSGGIATLLVVGGVAWFAPWLRRYDDRQET